MIQSALLKSNNIINDFWGGTAAMLVALPAAIAFGVTIYATLGGHYAAYGAIAGILGVLAIGIVAPLFGGTNRLISAPSAPAAAVLSAFALQYITLGIDPDLVFIMLMLVALTAGILQIVFGLIGLGRLIKYMPYPVVSGYLGGVGLYIIASQLPKFLGVPQGFHFWESVQNPLTWEWQSIMIGFVTIIAMMKGNKIFPFIPTVITALIAGIGTYAMLDFLIPPFLYPTTLLSSVNLRGVVPVISSVSLPDDFMSSHISHGTP